MEGEEDLYVLMRHNLPCGPWLNTMREQGWRIQIVLRLDGQSVRLVHSNGFVLDADKPAHLEILKAHQLAGTTPPPF